MEKNTSFTEGKILQPLILFAFPVLLALFLQAMYGAVDLLIVGKFATSADVSAVSTGSQIMTTLTNLISSFAMGTTILLGQQIGSGRRRKDCRNRCPDVCGNCYPDVDHYGHFCSPDQQHHECTGRSLPEDRKLYPDLRKRNAGYRCLQSDRMYFPRTWRLQDPLNYSSYCLCM